MDGTAVVAVLAGAVIVQAAAIVLLFLLHLRSDRAWSTERTRLLNLAVADTPREFATLQKAAAVTPDSPPEPAPQAQPMVGIGGEW